MPDRRRQSLQHQLAPASAQGRAPVREHLRAALDAAAAEPPPVDPDALTHGFHAYPARMHPAIARSVLQAFPGASRVLDPFCGGGTVLVEAMLAGRAAFGVDLNPVAVRVARVRTELRTHVSRDRFVRTVDAIAEASAERVRERVDVTAPIPRDQLAFYQPHVLKELGGLHAEIATVEQPADRRALEMVLSAIVVKFSRQRADTSERSVDKRIGKGAVTRFFAAKGHELAQRWEAVQDACGGARLTKPQLFEGDALDLGRLLPRRFVADLVLSSPPYGGTYDYADHHARRFPWLGMSVRTFRARELGARRHLSGESEDARERWDDEVLAMLRSIAEVLASTGTCILLVGDGEVGGNRIDAHAQLVHLAPEAGLQWVATASAPRPDWRGGPPRAEHLVALERIPSDSR